MIPASALKDAMTGDFTSDERSAMASALRDLAGGLETRNDPAAEAALKTFERVTAKAVLRLMVEEGS